MGGVITRAFSVNEKLNRNLAVHTKIFINDFQQFFPVQLRSGNSVLSKGQFVRSVGVKWVSRLNSSLEECFFQPIFLTKS